MPGGSRMTRTICKRCGESFGIGYQISNSQGNRSLIPANHDWDKGVACRACVEKRIEELNAADVAGTSKAAKRIAELSAQWERGF